MQRLFNVSGCLGFVLSVGMLTGATVLFLRLPSIANRYVSELKLDLTEMVTNMLPSQIDEALPELPTTTGPAVPIKSPF